MREKEAKTSLDDDQSWNSHPEALNKIHTSKQPRAHQKNMLMAHVRKTQSADAVGNAVRGLSVHPENLGLHSQTLDYIGPEGFRFDDQGMVLPHSILGSLEDFRSFLEARGDTELVKRIPKSPREPPSEGGRHRSEAAEDRQGVPSGHRNIQSNALQHWHTHMRQRRRQQNLLSGVLRRPVENLLMNQATHFREIQEQRALLNQVMPLIHSGYGYRVGSEFWSLPQRYGDEMSGITATLTQTEQGRWEPVTHIGQPSSIRRESGITCAANLRPASRLWEQSVYLQQQRQKLGAVLHNMDITKPDINGLEVIGSGKPFTPVTACPLLEREGEEKELGEAEKEDLDPLAQYDDIQSSALLIPALRFCGQLANWTGNLLSNRGEVGISATIVFEAPAGEAASSDLELRNEGSTAIFFNWQQLTPPRRLPDRRPQTKSQHFYFDSSSGVILPGDTKRVEFIFRSEGAGIKTDLWQLNTHPVLLQGASMQVTLRGLSLYQDKTADQRKFIETKLENIVRVKMCRSIVHEMLRGMHTPERPGSPAELYVTEEQMFRSKNPAFQYLDEPVEELKRLWQEVNPGRPWDLSISTLRQAVLSLPEQESPQDARERSLVHLNSLLLKLSEPVPEHHPLTAAAAGQQLWRKLLDRMADDATQLRHLLSLPERDTGLDKKDEPAISDSDLTDNNSAAVKEETSGERSRSKDDSRRGSRLGIAEKWMKLSKKKRKDEVQRQSKQEEESASLVNTQPENQNMELDAMDIYTKSLHLKVYALMEDLVDTLCGLMDQLNEGGDPHTEMYFYA